MDVYGESGRRAHRTGVVGVDSDTEDTIDNLEVYEALVNPKEGNSGGNKGKGGMMPPMMMGGGAGGGSSAAASAGASQAAAASTAGATARAVPGPMAAGATTAAPAVSPGVGAGSAGAAGTPSFGGGGAAGLPVGGGLGTPPGGGLAGGVLAAGSEGPADKADVPAQEAQQDPPADEPEDGTGGEGSVDPIGRIKPLPPQVDQLPVDVVEVNPAEMERLAKQWSSLSESMTGLSTSIGNLQADNGAFGMVRAPEPVYGKMTDGLHRRSGGAADEFEQISAGLAASAKAVRSTEDNAAASLGGLSQ